MTKAKKEKRRAKSVSCSQKGKKGIPDIFTLTHNRRRNSLKFSSDSVFISI